MFNEGLTCCLGDGTDSGVVGDGGGIVERVFIWHYVKEKYFLVNEMNKDVKRKDVS